MGSLLRTEAQERGALIDVTAYDLTFDFTRGDEVFGSRTVLDFVCNTRGALTFVELDAREIASITLNGNEIDRSAAGDGRIWLDGLAAHNQLVVEASMGYVRDGEGMHRAVDPQDGSVYLSAARHHPRPAKSSRVSSSRT